MPELPEVETVRRGLAPVLTGRCLRRVVTRRPDLRRPFPAGFADRLAGRRVLALDRRAKYLIWRLDDGQALLLHLGMSGRISIHEGAPPPPGPHDHVDFEIDSGILVRFTDARRFGLMDLCPIDGLDAHPLLAGLGLDPLAPGFDGAALAARFAGRQASLKAALMDQRLIAGIGNIYASESLFRARLSPRRRAGGVGGARADRLAEAVRQVLTEAIAAGGSSLRDHARPDGELGYFQHRFRVYGRAGAACPRDDCAGTLGRMVQSGRATFYCGACQR
ncbi:MAG: bifunctional DNA-formamidopyrimidine glycosylase/DNA-(apurinic or apyrimidinic site) lyase [Alphaproteobacteria bacterium]